MCIPGPEGRLQALGEVRRVLRPGGHFIFTTHDRDWDPQWLPFWTKERDRWERGAQDPRLLEFGDRIIVDSGVATFIHIPARDEVAGMVRDSGLVVTEDSMRSELCAENEDARRFSSDCRMWVLTRPTGEETA